MPSFLIKNIIIKGEKKDILISNGKISRIEDSIKDKSYYDVLDGGGMSAVPAFVNMHTHAAMTLLRGYRDDMRLQEWLNEIWKVEAFLDYDAIYWGTRLACLEMIKSGTVAFTDMYFQVDAAAKAVEDSGIKALLTYCFLDGGNMEKGLRERDECSALYQRSKKWAHSAMFGISVHAPYTVSDDNMYWAVDFARKHGLPVNIHLSETKRENEEYFAKYGTSPTKRLNDMGIWGKDVIAAHSLWLDGEDVEILGQNNVTVVHNINSNLKLASGCKFLYNELRDAGANVTLGTDGCSSSNNLDLLETMKTTALMQKGWRMDPTALPIPELMDMATINGAKALGLNSGRLEEGSIADILLINTNSAPFTPNFNFESNLIYSANSSCIDTVICEGKVLMSGRKVEGEERILRKASAEVKKIMSKIKAK